MGPSVKFFTRQWFIFQKKLWVNFFPVKKAKPGGGVRGGFGKRPDFFRFFSEPFSKTEFVKTFTGAVAEACLRGCTNLLLVGVHMAPRFGVFTIKKRPLIFFFENEPLMHEKNLHLVPSKKFYLLLLY